MAINSQKTGKGYNMDKIIIMLETRNDAFSPEPGTEAARILRELADKIDGMTTAPDEPLNLRDANGNKCGMVQIQ